MPKEDVLLKNGVGATERQTTGRAIALAQASGLEASSPIGARVRKTLVGFALILVAGASIGYYWQSFKSFGAIGSERNLVTPEEQSVRHIRVGEVAQLEGRTDEAIASFREALALTPSHLPTYIMLGQSYEAAGRIGDALKTYDLVVRRDATNLDARFQIAEIYRARGNWREAYQEYQRIIGIDSQSLQAVAALATIESHEGPQAESKRSTTITRQLTIAGGMTSLLPSVGWNSTPLATAPSQSALRSIGAPHMLFADKVGSERGDTRALAAAYKDRGMRYLNIRAYYAAIREIEASQRLNPHDQDLYYLLGSSYDGLGKDAQAYELYRLCVSGPYAGVAKNGMRKAAKQLRFKPDRTEPSGESEIGLPNRATTNSLK